MTFPSKSDAAATQIRSVVDSIRSIVRALRVSSRASEKECGMSAAQLFVLQQLQGEKGLSMNELAERTLTHQSSVSAVVSRLVERRLVRRATSASDSRRLELTLTEAGRRMIRKAPPAAQERLVIALRQLDAASRERLAELLAVLIRRAGFWEGAPPLFFEEQPRKRPTRAKAT